MSLRRELYKGRTGTPLAQGRTGTDENNHWARDWYDPLAVSHEDGLFLNTTATTTAAANSVVTTTTNTPVSNTPEASDSVATPIVEKSPPARGNDETGQLQGYEVKTWIIKNNGSDNFADCDLAANPSATHIDLKQYRYTAVLRKGVNLTASSVNTDSTNAEAGATGASGDSAALDADGISATDIKSAVGGSGVSGDTLFSSSASIGH